MTDTRYLDLRDRVKHGRSRENQIANALKSQAGLHLANATSQEDQEKKIDRWLVDGDTRTAVQIKYRETGDDLLFEVFDKWYGWDSPNNKTGRDMKGESKIYAVLRQDKRTVVMVPVSVAKKIIIEMLQAARTFGWSSNTDAQHKTLKYVKNGFRAELKVQQDPRDLRTKMVAYIPAGFFQGLAEVKTYKVNLPHNWTN